MSSGSALSAYATVKLRLAAVLENLLRFSQERKDEERSRFLQDLLSDLAEDNFRLAVFGKYNRGKSTLMNALLGMERLPTGVLPLTSVVTTVRYDSHEHVQILREGWSFPQDITLAQLPEYLTEEGNPGNEKKVILAQIFLPAEILRYGFFLIDTPGVGSSITANTKAAEAFIPRADAAIVVMSVESPLDEEELALLQRVHEQVGTVFVVLNKADLVSTAEREHITAVFADRVRSLIPDELPTFVLSARNALASLKTSSGERDEDLQQLTDALLAFISREKTGQFLRRMAERIQALVRDEVSLDYLAQRSSSDKKALLGGIKKTAEAAIEQGKSLIEQLKQTAKQDSSEVLQPHLLNWQVAATTSLAQEDDSAVNPIEHLKAQGVLRPVDLLPKLSETIDRLRQLVGQTKESASPGLLVKNQNGSQLGASAVTSDLTGLPSFGWSGKERFLLRLGVGTVPVLQRKLLLPALQRYLIYIRSEIARELEHRIRLLSEEYTNLIASIVERSKTAFDRPVKSNHAVALEQLSQELTDTMRLVEGQGHAEKSTEKPKHRGRSPKAICGLCEHLVDVQFHFVRQYQYKLSVDPLERTNNATRGGLCAFHTWLYESVSSPQGVCAGYSLVPLHWAATIEELQNHSDRKREQFEEIARTLLSGSRQCLACELLSSAEADKLDEITANTEKLAGATLCLPHLCHALSRENTVSAAPLLLEEMASTLRRLGEDMQQFALKKSGLRYGLTSAGERASYLNALRAIVGARPLSYIKMIVEI